MFWIVSYDIPSNKRRAKVAKTLEGYGRRAQYSVFECEISAEKSRELERKLMQIMDPQADDIRFYPMNRADLKRVRLLGRGQLHRARSYYMVDESGTTRSDDVQRLLDDPNHPF